MSTALVPSSYAPDNAETRDHISFSESSKVLPLPCLPDMMSNVSNTTNEPPETVFCPPFREIYIGVVDSSVPYFVNAALSSTLAIVTILANLVVLLALRHVTSIRLPSKLLLCSLVVTDLGAGLVVFPHQSVYVMRRSIPDSAVCPVYMGLKFTGSVFSGASLFTLTVISLDRYAALFYKFKYEEVVTTRRVCAALGFMWSFALFYGSTGVWNFLVWSGITGIGLIIAFPVITVAYIKIYRRLRSQQVQSPNAVHQQPRRRSLSMARYKRTASAMMWVYVGFLVCFMPYLLIAAVTATRLTPLIGCIREFAYTLLLLNSCLNPFIYCLRLPDIRAQVIKQLRESRYQSEG